MLKYFYQSLHCNQTYSDETLQRDFQGETFSIFSDEKSSSLEEETYSFWTHKYHEVIGVMKINITVSVITKSLCFFKFVWKTGPDGIARKLAIKILSSDILRTPYIYSLIKALKMFYSPFQGGTFLWSLYVVFVLCLLCLYARLLICALWSPAGKGLTSRLSFVVSDCEFVAFPLVSWVRCGT